MRFATWRGFDPLRHSRFRLLAAGQLTSGVGNAFFAIALPWYVLQVHGGTVLLGTVLAAYGIARIATLIPGGSAADRWRPWTVMLVTDTVQAALTALLAVVAATGQAALWELLPVGVVMGAADGLFTPGASAIVPSLLPPDALQAGNSLLSGGAQLASLVGPAIGGAVVAIVGPAPAFGVDSLTFVVSVLSLTGVRLRDPDRAKHHTPDHQRPPPGNETDGPTAWQLLRHERLLQMLLLFLLVANLGSGGLFSIAYPDLARGPFHLGADGYGALIASGAAGGLLGVLAAAHLSPGRRPALRATWLFLVANAFLAIAPYLGGPLGAGIYLLIFVAVNTLGNMILFTQLQKWAPPASLGRTMSLISLASLGIYPVSVALTGLLVSDFGPALFFPLTALIDSLALLAALTQAQYRNLGAETRPSNPTSQPDRNPQITGAPTRERPGTEYGS